MNVQKGKFLVASIVMASAVGIGAFGAHGLKPYLDTYGLDIFKTASFYHFFHGMALFLVLLVAQQAKGSISGVFYSFLVGILLFSGSLYVLALRSSFDFIPSWLGAITPIGGLFFIMSWLLLGFKIFSKKN